MPSETDNDAPSHRRRHDEDRSDRRERARDSDRHERRRSRDRHDKRDRRRSKTPDPSSRRRHSRDRGRDEGADGHKDRRRRRSREERHRRHRSHDDVDDGEREKKKSKATALQRAGPLPSQQASFAVSTGEEPEKPKEAPNFGNSGLLAAASNSVTQADGSTVTLKYHEPAEARKPSPRDQWKLFVFKGKDIVDTIDLSARSCWLVGRENAVVDLLAEHPSISKQHAVIQFRYTEKRNEFGDKMGKVKPYLIDLESANGTALNDDKIPDSRYLELRDKDMIQFGDSTREYVVMLAPRT